MKCILRRITRILIFILAMIIPMEVIALTNEVQNGDIATVVDSSEINDKKFFERLANNSLDEINKKFDESLTATERESAMDSAYGKVANELCKTWDELYYRLSIIKKLIHDDALIEGDYNTIDFALYKHLEKNKLADETSMLEFFCRPVTEVKKVELYVVVDSMSDEQKAQADVLEIIEILENALPDSSDEETDEGIDEGIDEDIDEEESSKQEEPESSMYQYDIIIDLGNPCNSNDMKGKTVNILKFDFKYNKSNGYGNEDTYTYDMSWDGTQNRNSDTLKNVFVRPNDTKCETHFRVSIPGIVKEIKVSLDMDGGERLSFFICKVLLNGYRVNTTNDGVSSSFWPSSATIKCRTLKPKLISKDGIKDQFDGVFTKDNISKANDQSSSDYGRMIYHYDFNEGEKGSSTN